MNGIRRFLSIWLALLMCLSVLAPAALADAEPAAEAEPPAETEEPLQEQPAEAEPIEPADEPEETPEEALPEGETAEPAPEDEPSEAEAPAQDDGTVPDIELSAAEQVESYAPGGDDNDALFAGYVEAFMGAALPGAVDAPVLDGAKKNIGATLTGATKAMYDALRPMVAAVAAGEETSTVFEVPFEDLVGGKTSWTAEELGVSSIISNNAISQEAQDAYMAMIGVDLSLIIDALLADCPYEMYWYDKTHGTAASWSYGFSCSGRNPVYLLPSGSYTLSFSVAAGYAAAEHVTNGAGSAVTTAVTRAQQTVTDNAGLSDYQKLDAYRAEICRLTDYNHDAADPSTNTAYGDPWQLIWVFDGDPTTTVVCEGYSKAFQYLCDLTEFSGNITCWHVTGDMDGGGHMWNIVTMEDGKNYLVDITNCDDDSIGYPDLLFLKGYSSGSAANGYVYDCHGIPVTYVYDEETLGMYTTADLTLSAADYVPGSSHAFTVTATASGFSLTGAGVVEAQELGEVDGETVVMLDPRATGVTQEAAAILSQAQAVLIQPANAEQSCAGLLSSLETAGLDNARMMGDADRDGMTMASDMSRILRLAAGDLELDDVTLLALDVNEDGIADRQDAQALALFIVG